MSGERWQRVQQVLEDALERPGPERRAFVESACAGDAALRAEVLSLLDADAVDDLPTHWLGAVAGPNAQRFAPGDLAAGRYRIRSLIGRGGVGEVYEAEDEELGITVALKTLRERGGNAASLEALKLEGMLARAVWHPNVCRVYELVRHDEDDASFWCLAMERLHGPTLAERLREEGRFPLARALHIAEGIGAGLGAAHRAGVVHRDLKPANVLLVERDGDEHAVVTDFGTGSSARVVHEKDPGLVFGTPAYMAPEHLRGEDVGPAADIFAFGLVLHELVTGTLPSADGPAAGLDARWDAVIRRCLESDPQRRFARAEDVAEALAGRTPLEPTSVATRRRTLPPELDPFVGREADLAALASARAAGARVLTLLGPGGMGKTRLAIRFGSQTAEGWPGGAWFCDLTEARDANGVASAVGLALEVQLGRSDPVQQLGFAIAGRGPCLIVLDNFEQVARHAAETVGRWRSTAPDAVFLVTTRVRLGLDGEWTREVEPLADAHAQELFALRARALRPGIDLAAEDESAREIVRLLDGIPLAIELAAARVRDMSVPRILEGIRKRLRLLAGGTGARHETLESTIDGSWELLAPWEQAAWAQSAVFEGGATLDALNHVLDLAAWPGAPPTVDVVRSLVDKSLLRSVAPPGAAGGPVSDVRFALYVTLQEYARVRLRTSAYARPAEERHGEHFARDGSDAAIAALDRRGGARLLRRLDHELDNLVAACRRAVARGDGATAAATFRAAWRVLKLRGPLATAFALGAEALADPRLTGTDRAIVAVTLGEASWYAGRYEDSRAHCEAALAIVRAVPDPGLASRAATYLGRSCFALGRNDEAATILTAAIAAARSADDRPGLCAALNAQGVLDHEAGRAKEARLACAEALAIARDLGDRAQEAVALLSLGIFHHKHDLLDEAEALYEYALAIQREIGSRRSEGIVRLNLGSLHILQGNPAEARDHIEAALAIGREIGSPTNEGVALTLLGEMQLDIQQWDGARESFEAALAIHRALGDRRVEGVIVANLARIDERMGETERARHGYEAALAILRDMGDARYKAGTYTDYARLLLSLGAHDLAREQLALGEPILREVASPLELALALCVRAELEQACGAGAAARAALGEAEALASGLRDRPDSELGRALARARKALTD